MNERLLSIAPMMGFTDRHDRYFLRLIAPHAWLYTEMLTAKAMIHGDRSKLLMFDTQESPLALQVAGNDPKELSDASKIAEDYGFDEVNLNVGCPSPRVQKGRWGACLMAEPELVADCIGAMINTVKIPVTMKTRIGIDELDSYKHLHHFIQLVKNVGCKIIIIHARKAWLEGLNPKQNRNIPPLKYEVVYQLKQDFPDLTIIINGGISSVDHVSTHLQHVDGVMLGREAYHNPFLLHDIERTFFSSANENTRRDIIHRFLPYVDKQLKQGIKLSNMTRHILGLFKGQVGAKHWRRYLTENGHHSLSNTNVIVKALQLVETS